MMFRGTFDRTELFDVAPALRNLPSVTGVALSLLTILLTGGSMIDHPEWLWLGVGLIALTELAALVVKWRELPGAWVLSIPLVTLVGLGFFRVGTGGSFSMFSVVLLFPIVWVAVESSWRPLAIGSVVLAVSLMLPYLLGTETVDNGQIVRVLFITVAFYYLGVILHEIARYARVRLDRVTDLSDERARLLREAEHDRAELSRAADRLRAAEAFSESIWNALQNEAVIVTDVAGRIIAWGPGAAILFGYAADPDVDEHGRPRHPDTITDLVSSMPVPAEGAENTREDGLERLISIGGSVGHGDGEVVFADASGRAIPEYLSCSERRDAAGAQTGYTFVARDARYAQEIARLKDEFVGTVSHELRTPLSSILGYLELVAEDDDTLTDDQRRFLGVAQRNAQRLLHLVGDLLFIAQVDGGKVPVEISDVDLVSIAAASTESVQPVATRAGVTAVAELPDGPVVVPGDARRLGQAIDNLVSNAVKFTPKGGTVTVSLRRDAGEVVVAVADTGMGIPPEELSQLTERFFRTRMATRQAIQGVGLGLTITKAIVTAHRGTLAASSVVGEGTVFEIRLPVAVSGASDPEGGIAARSVS